MIEKRGRGQPKFEPTQEQRNQVKLMKALAKSLPNSNAAPKTLVIGRRRTASIPIEHRPGRSALTGDVRDGPNGMRSALSMSSIRYCEVARWLSAFRTYS